MSEKKVAVILAGCGFLDGAEIRESVLALLNLDTLGVSYDIFAPNTDQHHTINHAKGEEVATKRNMMEEAARIARGQIQPLNDLKISDYAGVVFPGGFGVAKNFCTFAFQGAAATTTEEVKRVITGFHHEQKPIAAICIAPALIALNLGNQKVKVTIGTDTETATEVEKTGAVHENCQANQWCVDDANKVVSTPAYMFDSAPLNQINEGIAGCLKQLSTWL